MLCIRINDVIVDYAFWLFSRYDIPVLHIDDVYWAKHRLTTEEAIAALVQAREGSFRKSKGEPDAGRLEHS